MKYQSLHLSPVVLFALFVLFVLAASPLSIWPQTNVAYTRASISGMDVVSRAALFEPMIAEAARKEGVDPLILWVIAYNESRFRPWLTSPKNAKGMMQFIPATAKRFGLDDPYEPRNSILASAKYVKFLGGLFDQRLDSILAAYNSGEGTVTAYSSGITLIVNGKKINPLKIRTIGGVPPYKETRNYVANGLRIYAWLVRQNRFPLRHNVLTAKQIPNLKAVPQIQLPVSSSPKSTEKQGSSAFIVLYVPRTGQRELLTRPPKSVESNIADESITPKPGPVIVSPETRPVTNQIARSTFAGVLSVR